MYCIFQHQSQSTETCPETTPPIDDDGEDDHVELPTPMAPLTPLVVAKDDSENQVILLQICLRGHQNSLVWTENKILFS